MLEGAQAAPPPSGHEVKFVVTAKRADRVRDTLDRLCRPDPEHPRTIVTSIYYDTHGLHCLGEKLNSDYLKSKFRIRWYRAPGQPPEPGSQAFAEAKFRVGNQRRKLRIPAPFDPAWLQSVPLEEPRLLAFTAFLRRQGVPLRHALMPSMSVEYERRRYVDPVTGARLCVDTSIRAPRINSALLPRLPPGVLETAVVEMKGGPYDLPPHLYILTDLGCRRASWSKYAACYGKLMGYL